MPSPGRTDRRALVGIVVGLALTVSLSAQARPGPYEPPRPVSPAHVAERASSTTAGDAAVDVKLVYDREVYSYPGETRRDPFVPLLGANRDELGPRFEDLVLRGIIFSPNAGQSMALLTDPSGKIYRVRQGNVVGNARISIVEPLRVLFQVETFGVARQEQLELKSPARGGRP